MVIVRIAAGPDLGRLNPHALIFFDQLIQRQIGERWIENTDGNFPARTRRVHGRSFILRSSSRKRARCGDGSGDDSACGCQKISASWRKRIGIRHVVPRRGVQERNIIRRLRILKSTGEQLSQNSKPPFRAALNSWVELLKRQAGGGHYFMRTLTVLLISRGRSAIKQKY